MLGNRGGLWHVYLCEEEQGENMEGNRAAHPERESERGGGERQTETNKEREQQK